MAQVHQDFQSRYLRGDFAELFSLPAEATQAALTLPRNTDRDALITGLRRYAKHFGAHERVFKNISSLRQPQTRAVVTGQQAGLLLGPMYSLSKAMTAITLAQELSTPESPVVPIFWVASQDADSAEIDHSYLLDFDEYLHRLHLPLPEGVPAGRIALQDAWLSSLLQAIHQGHWSAHFKQEVISLIEKTFAQSESMADWFSALMFTLLGEQGLIVIDPLQDDIAELFKPVLKAELETPLASSERITEAATKLQDLGEQAQLGRAQGASNLFIEQDNQRYLLRFEGSSFFTDQAQYRRQELLDILEQTPSRLTPAAGLRPITQDYLLPTAILVGGPGELRYLSQLKGVYELHDVAMPLIWPRATVTLLEPPVKRILNKYQLSVSDVQHNLKQLENDILLQLSGYETRLADKQHLIKQAFEEIIEMMQTADPTMVLPSRKARGHFEGVMDKLQYKLARALSKQDDITTGQLERLSKHLLPTGQAQERIISPFSFFLKFGVQHSLEQLKHLATQGDHSFTL